MLHPKEILSPEIVSSIKSHAFEAEQLRTLPQATLDIIYEQHWFQALTPRAFGGMELSLPEAVQLFEALTWADANVGWCVNLGAGANMFSGYLDAGVAASIFNSSQTCCAGSGAVSGKATITDGGYLLSGRWKYASGANHATHFTANAYIYNELREPVMENNNQVFRSFIIPAEKITNLKNWNAIGLSATSSNDFEVFEVFVPSEHTFTLLKPSTFAQGPVYKFPFAAMAAVNMSCMMTGIALHFLETFEELAQNKKPLHSDVLLKENPIVVETVNKASRHFHSSRLAMYQQLDEVWRPYEKGNAADDGSLQLLKQHCKTAAMASRKLIDELFPLCGMNIVFPQTELNKIWRDAAVASQHYLLSPLQG